MSIYKDGKLIAGGRQCMPLLSFMWADHQLNDISWLRADTFSWQSGAVYTAVYQHLADDIDGKTLQSETVGSTTIQFYLADDGHKICPASEESNVAAIYSATGVAWYYIIDTVNQRFKLPRTKFGFTGIRTGVGDYIEPGIPQLYGEVSTARQKYDEYADVRTGVFSKTVTISQNAGFTSGRNNTGKTLVKFDAQNYNPIYGNSTTVQPPATQQYLYFYVGNFTQTALENTAGLNASLFNGKADIDLSNAASNASTAAKQTIIGWGIPDLTTGVSVSTSGFTSTKKQWLCIRAGANNNYFDCLVNGIVVSTRLSNSAVNTSDWYPLDVGDVVTFTGVSSYFACETYDMKGL